MRALAHSHTSLLVVCFHCFGLGFCFFFFLSSKRAPWQSRASCGARRRARNDAGVEERASFSGMVPGRKDYVWCLKPQHKKGGDPCPEMQPCHPAPLLEQLSVAQHVPKCTWGFIA